MKELCKIIWKKSKGIVDLSVFVEKGNIRNSLSGKIRGV